MKYSNEGAEEISAFMRNFLQLKNKKEALLRSSGVATQMQTAGSTSNFSLEPNMKISAKHEQDLKAAYLVHP